MYRPESPSRDFHGHSSSATFDRNPRPRQVVLGGLWVAQAQKACAVSVQVMCSLWRRASDQYPESFNHVRTREVTFNSTLHAPTPLPLGCSRISISMTPAMASSSQISLSLKAQCFRCTISISEFGQTTFEQRRVWLLSEP